MSGRTWRLLPMMVLSFQAGCQTGSQPRTNMVGQSASVEQSPIDARRHRGATTQGDPSRALHFDPESADPSKLLPEQPSTFDSGPGPGPVGPAGLTLEVSENGPELPWVVRVFNEGDEPSAFVADTRLLWLDVKPPGSKRSSSCRLPNELLPKFVEDRLLVRLQPGEGVAQRFDPRLYCFAAAGQRLLVPGAKVTAHFGWLPRPPKIRWKGGKRIQVPADEKPPFVAWLLGSTDQGDAQPDAQETHRRGKPQTGSKSASPEASLEWRGAQKELLGTTFALRSEYAAWTSHGRFPGTTWKPAGPLQLTIVQGSDATAERTATVKLKLQNKSETSQRVYFRRELVTFEVTGPEGNTICNPTPDDRAPDRQAFVHLKPNGYRTYTSRLAELCPHGTFAIPGLYLVRARFDATVSGEEQGLNAYTGPVFSNDVATVRIRTGDQPLLHKRPMRKIASGRANGQDSQDP